MGSKFSEEDVMAFADGALAPAMAIKIQESAKNDSALQSRIELYRRTASLSKLAFKGSENTVDAKLLENIKALIATDQKIEQSSNVVRIVPKKKSTWMWPSALAASLALVIGYTGALMQTSTRMDSVIATGPILGDALNTALSNVPSGQSVNAGGNKVTLIATFKNSKDTVCREFEIESTSKKPLVSIACRQGAGWETLLIVASATNNDTYSPAGVGQTIETYLQTIGAAPALSDTEEAEVLKSLSGQTNVNSP